MYSLEQNNNFLRIYDEHEAYCINLNSGLQFSIDESNSCSSTPYNKNEICIKINNNRKCFEDLPLVNYSILSDNQNYVNLTIRKSFSSSEISLTYSLYNQDSKLYQDFNFKNNNLAFNIPISFSYIIKDIKIGEYENDETLLINGSYNSLATFNAEFYNLDEDGFSVIDTNSKYFHLNYNPYLNNFIYIKNSIINITYPNIQVPIGTSKSLLFSYFDPVGTCTSLADITNGSTGCWGNQFSVNSIDTFQIDGGQNEKIAFRFNMSRNAYVTGLSFCLSSYTGSGNIIGGIQYNNAATGRPNGTWIDNNTGDFISGCTSIGLFSGQNLSKNQVYHVVLDGSVTPIGVSKTVKWINPSQLKLPLDYSSIKNMQVSIYSASKWVTDSGGTNLFQLRFNEQSNLSREDSFGWTYDNSSLTRIYQNNVVSQFFTVPYTINASRIEAAISGNDGYGQQQTPLGNLFYFIRLNSTGENISTGQFTFNQSEFTNSTIRYVGINFSSNVTFYPNLTYIFALSCNECNSSSFYNWEYLSESQGHILPFNSTWNGEKGFATMSTNNGSTWSYDDSYKRSDRVFRIFASIKYSENSCSSGEILVADQTLNRVQRFMINGTFLAAISSPRATDIDSNNDFYFVGKPASYYLDRGLNKFNFSNNLVSFLPISSVGFINGIALDNDIMYLTDGSGVGGVLMKYNITNQTILFTVGTEGPGNGEFVGVHDVESYLDLIYVTDSEDFIYNIARVQIFYSNGTFKDKFGDNGVLYSAYGISIFNNTIYVVDLSFGKVKLFYLNGTFKNEFGSYGTGNGQFRQPSFIDVSNSTISVSDSGNNRIQLFYLNGTFKDKFGSSGSGNGQFSFMRGNNLIFDGNVLDNQCISNIPALYCESGIPVSRCELCGCSCGVCTSGGSCNLDPDNFNVFNQVVVTPFVGTSNENFVLKVNLKSNCGYPSTQSKIFSDVNIRIISPDSQILNILKLFDDGQHNDDGPNDNIYANTWYATNASIVGNYSLDFLGNKSWNNQLYEKDHIGDVSILQCTSVNISGPTEENLNLIFIPCDYGNNLENFSERVNSFYNYFLNQTPYYNHTEKFNIYSVDYPNLICTHYPGQNPYLPNYLSVTVANVCDTGTKKIVVLSNQSNHSVGWTWRLSYIMYMTDPIPWVLYHEAGHALPGLEDEYALFEWNQGGSPQGVNCDVINYQTGVACPRWCDGQMIPYSGNSDCIGQTTEGDCRSVPEGCYWLEDPDPYYQNSRCVPAEFDPNGIGTQCDDGTVCTRYCGHHWDWFKHEWPPDAMAWVCVDGVCPVYGSIDVREANNYMSQFGNNFNLTTIISFLVASTDSGLEVQGVTESQGHYIEQELGNDYKISLLYNTQPIEEQWFSLNQSGIFEEFNSTSIVNGTTTNITLSGIEISLLNNGTYNNFTITNAQDEILVAMTKEEIQNQYY